MLKRAKKHSKTLLNWSCTTRDDTFFKEDLAYNNKCRSSTKVLSLCQTWLNAGYYLQFSLCAAAFFFYHQFSIIYIHCATEILPVTS